MSLYVHDWSRYKTSYLWSCEAVWPSGKQRDLGSKLFRLSFYFKSCGLWTLYCDFVPHNYETLKWLSSLPIAALLNAEVILVVTV